MRLKSKYIADNHQKGREKHMKQKLRAGAIMLALFGALALTNIHAPMASAQPCMVNCWDWDGGWQGGGGLGGNPNPGSDPGGSDGGRVGGGGYEGFDPDGGAAGGGSWGNPSHESRCGGTDAVYAEYAEITVDCTSPPHDEIVRGPAPANHLQDGYPFASRAECEAARDISCDAFGAMAAAEEGLPWGVPVGLGVKHLCRLIYKCDAIKER
jgi:hypothetical protein